ncbi:MAG: hypothetical protein C3F14_05830 [Deltaproteobacteria bacterium]|nr:MAG: hypothetical protein C3F14_05830 [Deltaproteobacteria bacterium]
MKNAKRGLHLTVLALAMIVALSGAAFSSVTSLPVSPTAAHANVPGGSDLAADRNIQSGTSVWSTGIADGAGIPGNAEANSGKSEGKMEVPSAIESIVMLFLGICLIAIAMLGKRIFHR